MVRRLVEEEDVGPRRQQQREIEPAPLAKIANREKKMPAGFIRRDGYGITAAARRYLEPLIRGEASPPYGRDGLPKYVSPKNVLVKKKLPGFEP